MVSDVRLVVHDQARPDGRAVKRSSDWQSHRADWHLCCRCSPNPQPHTPCHCVAPCCGRAWYSHAVTSSHTATGATIASSRICRCGQLTGWYVVHGSQTGIRPLVVAVPFAFKDQMTRRLCKSHRFSHITTFFIVAGA